MKITTRITWDMASGAVLEHEWHEYEGPVALAKGADTAKQQLDLQNQLVKQQLTRQNSLSDQALAAVQPYLAGNVGFDPALLAALQSQFLNSNDQSYNAAGGDVRSALAARGAGTGQLPVGGDYTRGLETLLGSRANSQSQGLLGIKVSDLQQALSNKFNAANIYSGNAAQAGGNVNAFNAGASSSLGSYIQAANSGPLNQLLGGLGQGFGQTFGGALGAGAAGGIIGMLPKKPPGT